ncbi:hypothetical protein MBLNU230_g5200t1 [Neophaeotheca triangularis]
MPSGWQNLSNNNMAASNSGSPGRESPGEDSKHGRTSPPIYNPYYTGRPKTPISANKHGSIDRQEIIRRIKSKDGQSRPTSPEVGRPGSRLGQRRTRSPEAPTDHEAETRPASRGSSSEQYSAGMEIERPRSALHRGDFREKEHDQRALGRFAPSESNEQAPVLSTSPVAPWHADFPAAAFRQAWNERRVTPTPASFQQHYQQQQHRRPSRPRAGSNASLSHSFSYQPPTSPLVNAIRPDTPEPTSRHQSRSPDKSRRHTYSPPTLKHYHTSLDYPTSARSMGGPPVPTLRKEATAPYRAHQPRRSFNSIPSAPQSPSAKARRPSLSDGPRMVGSYEESILRGRMSTTPSKPLNFVAQIGVLGKGNCKSNLKCPKHVTVPFPAVFFSYGSPDEGPTAGQPSPYVGNVDLENNLENQEPSPEKRNKRVTNIRSPSGSRSTSRTRDESQPSDSQARLRRKAKQKRRSSSPKAPPGGSYRIPQCGQLQIIIKNPNKTAVKLFLVPYDLSDMEPGQKTFIRQRSYSAGPIIDMPLATRKNLGTDRPEAAISAGGEEDPRDRPMLRYLIHLHICSPSKGRFYLYKTVRVVFANRVPDGKENLRNEIQLPEPRYSAYKPSRDSNVGLGAGLALASNGVISPTPSARTLSTTASNTTTRDFNYPLSTDMDSRDTDADLTWPPASPTARLQSAAQSLPTSNGAKIFAYATRPTRPLYSPFPFAPLDHPSNSSSQTAASQVGFLPSATNSGEPSDRRLEATRECGWGRSGDGDNMGGWDALGDRELESRDTFTFGREEAAAGGLAARAEGAAQGLLSLRLRGLARGREDGPGGRE